MFGKKIAAERLEEDLCQLARRVADLESGHKRLELEWTETYDKVRHQLSRMAKRQAVNSGALDGAEPPNPDNEPSDGLDPISRSILRRRGMRIKQT